MVLKYCVIELIKCFEMNLCVKLIEFMVINNVCYCLCVVIDEVVLNVKWSLLEWVEESLLFIFYKEIFGGEYFFILLDEVLVYLEMNWNFLEL